MTQMAPGVGGGLDRTHSERPKAANRLPKSGLADFQPKNLQAYEISGLARIIHMWFFHPL
jgi:hypothetical protein